MFDGQNASEVARATGIDATYVGRWRKGEYPTRLQESTRKRLLEAVATVPPEGRIVRERDPGTWPAGSPEFYDGVLFAAQAMSETVTRLLAEARVGLRTEPPPAKRTSPTAGEIAVGLEAMAAADAAAKQARGRRA